MADKIRAWTPAGVIGVALAVALAIFAPRFASTETLKSEAARASEIDATLKRVRLPPGFAISLYALAPGARTLAIGRAGKAIFVGTADDRIYVLTPGAEKAATVEIFAPTMKFTMPHGLCFTKDGALFVVERNRVTRFDDAENTWREAASRATIVAPAGELIPRAEESRDHSARVCRVGPDDRLYISLGQPHNVTPREKLALYTQLGIGGVIRMNLDGTGREVFATGVRNSVGMDFNPADGSLWFTDNQVDRMGDDIPPGEINRAEKAGLDFGFPWYGGGHVRTNEYAGETPPNDVVFPMVEEAAHAADLGMIFYRGAMLPADYRGGIFSAQHGSWDRSVPIGARVMFTPIDANGAAGASAPFAEGWNADGNYLGRPVDVAELADGSLLVTDDHNGAVYRIAYRAP